MFAVALTLVVCSVSASCAEEENRAKFHVCGKALADTLYAVCNSFNKRSFADNNYIDEDSRGVLRSRRSALSLRLRRQSRYRGVATECCYKSCTYDELTSYCAS